MDNLEKLSKKELLIKLREKKEKESLIENTYDSETDKLDKLSNISNPNSIPFKEISDHKNIMLWTAVNKPVGPLHPDNARRTMARWRRAGVQLFTRKRTDAEVEAFKKTDEWKTYMIKNEATRKLRHSQSAKGKVDKMVQDVARVTAEAVAGAMKK